MFLHLRFPLTRALLGRINLSLRNVRQISFAPILPRTKYGGRFTVTMIAGDGHGPKMMEHLKNVFRASGAPVDFEEVLLDSNHLDCSSVDAAVKSVQRNGIAIKGNIITNPLNLELPSRNVILRSRLNLFANVLHCKSLPSIQTRHKHVDLLLIRQNTEGEYSCLEHSASRGVVESLKIVTRERSEEIARFAFEFCKQNERKKITSVHKTNVMPLTDGMFLDACSDVAKDYPDIELESVFLDKCCSKLVLRPQQFDVLLMSNLYGNVLSSIACGLIGGAGVVPGVNFGHDCVVFEVGSRSSAATLMSPLAMLNAGSKLLQYLELVSYAGVIEQSVDKALGDESVLYEDLSGTAEGSAIVGSVINHILAIDKN